MRLNSRGLTLIEVTIAIMLAVIVLSMLLGAMRLAYRSEEKGRERSEVSQRMRIITDRLSWILHGAYPFRMLRDEGSQQGATAPVANVAGAGLDIQNKPTLVFDGSPESLTLVTTSVDPYSHGPIDNPGLKRVSIGLANGLAVQEGVYYMEAQMGIQNTYFVVDPTVKSLEFSYLYVSDQKEGWTDSWDTSVDDCLPAAVKATVSFDFNGNTIKMPPIITALKTGGTCVEKTDETAAPKLR